MAGMNIVQKVNDADTLQGQDYAAIQAYAQGILNTHAISGIHTLVPVVGDLIAGDAGGAWKRLPKDVDNSVLTMISGSPTWSLANSLLSILPINAGDIISGVLGGGSWGKLAAGAEKSILTIKSGVPAWVAKDFDSTGQWVFVMMTTAGWANKFALATPATTLGVINFNVNGTLTYTMYTTQGDIPGWYKQSGGTSSGWSADGQGGVRFALVLTAIDGGQVTKVYDGTIISQGTGIAIKTIDTFSGENQLMMLVQNLNPDFSYFEANLTTVVPPVGIMKGALVGGNVVSIANNVPFPYTTVTWTFNTGTGSYDMNPAFWSAVNPTRLTIPPGVSQVRLQSQGIWGGSIAGSRLIGLLKNGAAFLGSSFDQRAANPIAGNSTCGVNVSTPVLSVLPGDYFEVAVFQDSGAALNFGDPVLSWFALEVIT
jgi:hypothetical protein